MTAPTPWSRFTMPWQFAFSSTGAPSPGDKLYFYVGSSTDPGTSTPKDTYADATLSTPNSNPLVADQSGIFRSDNGAGTTDCFLASDVPYKVVWKDKGGVEKGTANPVSPYVPSSSAENTTIQLEWTIDGNGGIPGVGKVCDLYVSFACTIVSAVMQADQPGDAVVDIWVKEFETNTPPTATDSIVASAPPTLGASVGSIDTVLTGWSKDIAAGSWVRLSLTSIATITRLTITLNANKASA